MVSTGRHVIQVGEFELNIRDEAHVKPLFEIVNHLNAGPLKDLIEKYCDLYCPPQETHRIETLELNLGVIPTASFEQKFLEQFEKELSAGLKAAIGKNMLQKEKPAQRTEPDLELFVFYLQNGSLPWWVDSQKPSLLQEALDRLIEKEIIQLRRVLPDLLLQPNVRKRFASLNGKPGFMQIIQLLTDQSLIVSDELPVAFALSAGISERKIISQWREIFLEWLITKQLFSEFSFFQDAAGAMGIPLVELIAGIEQGLTKSGKTVSRELTGLLDKIKLLHKEKLEKDADLINTIAGNNLKGQQELPRDAASTDRIKKSKPGQKLHQDADAINHISEIETTEKKNQDDDEKPADHTMKTSPEENRYEAADAIDQISETETTQKKGQHDEEKATDRKIKTKPAEKSIRKTVDLQYSESEELFLDNAGLVLIAPFLPNFFQALGMVEENNWIDTEAQHKGIAILYFLVYGLIEVEEYNTTLLKVFCGLQPGEPFEYTEPLEEENRNECVNLLESVVAHATVLGNLSIDGFRGSYLLRPGLLGMRDGNWLVQVERRSYDILLDKIPWSYRMVRLPWLKRFIVTEW